MDLIIIIVHILIEIPRKRQIFWLFLWKISSSFWISNLIEILVISLYVKTVKCTMKFDSMYLVSQNSHYRADIVVGFIKTYE